MDDKRHEPYLIAAIIKSVDRKKHRYEVQRINDNHIEFYPQHQIVQRYDKDIHSIDINKHKQKIQTARNTPDRIKIKTKTKNKSKKRKRSNNNPTNSEQTNHSNGTQNGLHSETRPNKKRKLNDDTASNIINGSSTQTPNQQKLRPNNCTLTVAQPYFPKVEWIHFFN